MFCSVKKAFETIDALELLFCHVDRPVPDKSVFEALCKSRSPVAVAFYDDRRAPPVRVCAEMKANLFASDKTRLDHWVLSSGVADCAPSTIRNSTTTPIRTMRLKGTSMDKKILITTFDTWEPHQTSNASDDLLHLLLEKEMEQFQHLRSIPVDFELSPKHVLAHFEALKPKILVCCGMAEERSKLNVESQAVRDGHILRTGIDLEKLTDGLMMTEISHDTGTFVCNALYYRMLEHFETIEGEHYGLFVHVPVLTAENKDALVLDFERIILRLAEMVE